MSNGFRYERQLADKLEQEGWHVERVASSGRRKNSVCDLVGIKDGVPYLIEVKTRKGNVFYTKAFKKDLERMIKTAKRVKAVPLLVVLFKRKGWRFVELKNIPQVITYYRYSYIQWLKKKNKLQKDMVQRNMAK